MGPWERPALQSMQHEEVGIKVALASESTKPQDEHQEVFTLYRYQEDKCFQRVVSERPLLRLANDSL